MTGRSGRLGSGFYARICVVALVLAIGCGDDRARDQSVPGGETSAWSEESPQWGPRARLQSAVIAECSGIVRSRQYPGVYWVHNDSGDEARIFAINARGDLLKEVAVEGASHVDWEEITADDDGNLYVCDIGNNRSARRDLVIYVIREPDLDRDRSVTVHHRLRFRYPDQAEFPDPARNHDCEAAFWRDDHLYLLSKHRSDTWTRLYRLEDPSADDHEQVLALLDSLDTGSMVTAADLSPDGSELALLTYDYLFLCDLPGEGDRFLSDGSVRRMLFEARQSEAVAHDGAVLVVVNEQGEIHRLARDAVWEVGEAYRSVDADRPFVPDPAVPPALAGGYCPPRRRAVLEPGATVSLELEPAAGEKKEPAPGPDEEAEASIRCEGDGMRVELSWPAAQDPSLVMMIAWGELTTRTIPGPGDQVWSVNATARGFEAHGMDPHSERLPELALVRRGGRVEGSITLPGDCPPAAFNLNLIAASGGEWCWGGEWSMRGPVNPFLWGELVPSP